MTSDQRIAEALRLIRATKIQYHDAEWSELTDDLRLCFDEIEAVLTEGTDAHGYTGTVDPSTFVVDAAHADFPSPENLPGFSPMTSQVGHEHTVWICQECHRYRYEGHAKDCTKRKL